MSFAGPDEVLVERLSRGRDGRAFLIVSLKGGGITTVYAETDPAWVDASYAANASLELAASATRRSEESPVGAVGQ